MAIGGTAGVFGPQIRNCAQRPSSCECFDRYGPVVTAMSEFFAATVRRLRRWGGGSCAGSSEIKAVSSADRTSGSGGYNSRQWECLAASTRDGGITAGL